MSEFPEKNRYKLSILILPGRKEIASVRKGEKNEQHENQSVGN